jgi:hypothetical protein
MPSSTASIEISQILILKRWCAKVESKSVELLIKIRECSVQMNIHNRSKLLHDNRVVIESRHDRNPRFSKSLSRLEIYYSRLPPVISRLLIINTMLQTH